MARRLTQYNRTVSQYIEEGRPMHNGLLFPRRAIVSGILGVCLLATAFVPLATANEVLK